MPHSFSLKLQGKQARGTSAASVGSTSDLSPVGIADASLSHSYAVNLSDKVSPTVDQDSRSQTGIRVLHRSKSSKVDVVAVHGLEGNLFKTWQHENQGMWLKDFLPRKFEQSKIMTFGYNSKIRSNSVAGIQDVASALLQSLYLERNEDETSLGRPIVFICHSLGGIVVKRAIALAHSRPEEEYNDILKSTKSIAFLAVPHGGANIAKWATRVAKIGASMNTAFVEDLERNAKALNSISMDFKARAANLKIWSFYETRKTSGHLVSSPLA